MSSSEAPIRADKPIQEEAQNENSGVKRPCESSTAPDTKRFKREPIPEKDVEAIRTQIEYYLSDKNLEQDQFFYDIIKNDAEGVIPLERLMSCRKLQLMKADEALCKQAIENSADVELVKDGVRRKDNKALPAFVGRPERPNNNNERRNNNDRSQNKMRSIKPVVIHANGAVVAVSGLHEDTAYVQVKEAVNNALKSIYEGVTNSKGGSVSPVNFCGHKSPRGVVHLVLSRMDGDLEKIKHITEIEIEGEKFPFHIEHDQFTAQQFFKTIPKGMAKSLGPRTFNPKVVLGKNQSEFDSIEHLRKCCKELLEVTPLDTELTNNGADVLEAIISYHPDPTKMENMRAIKVAAHKSSSEKEVIRSFFVVKEDGETIDFSYIKCLNAFTMKLIEEETNKLRPIVAETIKPEASETEETA